MKKIFHLIFQVISTTFLTSCSDGSTINNVEPDTIDANITVLVKDDRQNPYANALITSNGINGIDEKRTDVMGEITFKITKTGIYNLTLKPPLGTTIPGESTVKIEAKDNQNHMVIFDLLTRPTRAFLNSGVTDVFEELKTSDGKAPQNDNDLLFASNVFDAPLGQLTPITAPNGDQLKFSEWKNASGTVQIYCNGNKSMAHIKLTGLIAGGTYTIWANLFRSRIKSGEKPNLTELIKIVPIGSGSLNVMKATLDGVIDVKIEHPTCFLTEAEGAALPIIYHINGKTFGSAHIPDPEEIAQLLVFI